MEHINRLLSGTVLPIAISIFAILFITELKGMPLSKPERIISDLLSKDKSSWRTSLRAVLLALAGTLGVGNIVGVASAIALGGAGAVFWMWVSAFLAMILKYCEVTLALVHRRSRESGYYGGAMYYMTDHFNSCHKKLTGIVYSLIFTFLCLMNAGAMGCMIQANSISESVNMSFGLDKRLIGLILAALAVIVFFLNGNRLFALCEGLIPAVSLLYIGMCLVVIFSSSGGGWASLKKIIEGAFSIESIGGGAVGFLTSRALRYGTVRGLFSNEAGCGTSPIAHATASTDSPCKQGILGIFEVFIDTVVVCTITALVILPHEDLISRYETQPMLMVANVFERELGEASTVILSACVFLFAFATIICWGYYGKECIYFINKSPQLEKAFYAVYVALIFFGSFIKMELVWQIADFVVGSMTIMNLYILWKMRKEIKYNTFAYFNKKELPKRKPKC